ncbi:GntR family transcriptional regulator [Terricaulis sp.]|uniref:GntR family transcriptional regulator n=1 Tax=Terricaulis sp. TaxID=2768686 RepID=UPI002AC4B8B5|nr:GntR family transcriptional regulator [Terricaulis sp.]MDZ4690061.1 GntR family transcriptional regulator [Terricaulis sp.]
MAPDASAAQRAYEEIKKEILDGALPVQSRLDVEALARTLGLSSMPVRQALSLLTWERLVRPGRHSAYEVALWSELDLAQLYEWRGALLSLALPSAASGPELKRIVRTQPYAEAVQAVMGLIEAGANLELRRAATNADERLLAARRVEAEVLGDVQGEFEALVAALADRSRRASTLQRAYVRRRINAAPALRQRVVLKALPSNGAPR